MAAIPPRPSNTKRRPTVLVTDSRDQRLRPESLRKSSIRFVSVDNVLSSSSEIPSAIQRNPLPTARRNPLLLHTQQARRPSDLNLKNSKLVGQTNIPVRTSKITEKLVLLPDPEEAQTPPKGWDFDDDNNAAPLRDDEEVLRSESGPDSVPRKSYAERLPKNRRAEKLPRVAAFCTANAYRLQAVSNFLRDQHKARTKLYDECLYAAYHLPLLPGNEGNRVKSSPALKSPGGKTVLDAQIERSENRDYHEEYFRTSSTDRNEGLFSGDDGEMGIHEEHPDPDYSPGDNSGETANMSYGPNANHDQDHVVRPMSPEIPEADVMAFAEMFLYSYGVVVFWNFTERQERDILADLTFAVTPQGTPLLLQPMQEDEYETEEFHFEYSPKTTKPRIYNDMITLRSGDHMIKLAMSHAIAQSTKLSMFEERMAMTMREVEHIPRRLALTGTLGMKREEVLRMSGKLFKLRVDVNLSSNTLDTPEFFWDSEPALHPLYMAVREYLEIKQRVLIVNEKCRVFLDLTAILADSIADHNMSRITWIIIILIVLSILVTLGEVTLRFSILKGKA